MTILYIAFNDFVQMLRDRNTYLFLLIMPIAFTLLFGFAFKGQDSGPSDQRLPVGFINQDAALQGGSTLSQELEALLGGSSVIRLDRDPAWTPADLEKMVAKKDLAAALVIPAGYGASLTTSSPLRLTVFADASDNAGLSARNEILSAASRLNRSVQAAQVVSGGGEAALRAALDAWQNPPVRLAVAQASAVAVEEPAQTANPMSGFAHSAPGMMLQFAIAGLLTCAQVIVAERKSRCMQRLLTTAVSRAEILLGHYLSIFALVLTQFIILIVFGQFILKLDYLRQPLATLLVAVAAALCIAAMGLLIGILSKSDEQAIIFSLVPMFVFSGLGGAWVPLEITGPAFQAIGHITPVAWAMDGFKGILLRGLNLQGVLLPAAALIGYALLFFALAAWRFKPDK
jgi:ABC-2 type transport system permease protein